MQTSECIRGVQHCEVVDPVSSLEESASDGESHCNHSEELHIWVCLKMSEREQTRSKSADEHRQSILRCTPMFDVARLIKSHCVLVFSYILYHLSHYSYSNDCDD